MGLTSHYNIRCRARSAERARERVEQTRQLALDLPFDHVADSVVDLDGEDADFDAPKYTGTAQDLGDELTSIRWLLIQASEHVSCPWNRRISRRAAPDRVFAFSISPGEGCEPANLGLCRYPAEIEWEYTPCDDRRFEFSDKEWERLLADRRRNLFDPRFDWKRWRRWCRRNGMDGFPHPEDERFRETRKVRTRLGGWSWGSFSKTQYASNPDCGGVPNFLRCHVSLITLLERIGDLPGVSVRINDEGRYGPHHCSKDWQEARAAGREPTYRDWPGNYDPQALAEQVGSWNEMIAAQVGALNGALAGTGLEGESPITAFGNLEQLEFRGSRDEKIGPFLEAMKRAAAVVLERQAAGA
jgi:hypothetical protein